MESQNHRLPILVEYGRRHRRRAQHGRAGATSRGPGREPPCVSPLPRATRRRPRARPRTSCRTHSSATSTVSAPSLTEAWCRGSIACCAMPRSIDTRRQGAERAGAGRLRHANSPMRRGRPEDMRREICACVGRLAADPQARVRRGASGGRHRGRRRQGVRGGGRADAVERRRAAVPRPGGPETAGDRVVRHLRRARLCGLFLWKPTLSETPCNETARGCVKEVKEVADEEIPCAACRWTRRRPRERASTRGRPTTSARRAARPSSTPTRPVREVALPSGPATVRLGPESG